MKKQRQLLLGIFFAVALSVLAAYTLFLTDVHFFTEPTREVVYFPEAYGLREGDPVQVSGLRIGRVKELDFDINGEPRKRIRAVLLLDKQVELLRGAKIKIAESTLLGGRHIDIDPGEFGGPVLTRDPDGALYGSVQKNPIQALADLGAVLTENREAIAGILNNTDAIVADVREGRGTVGRFLSDEGRADEGATTLSNIRDASDQLRNGEGVLGALFYDEELRETVDTAVANLESIGKDIRAGRGTVGRLIYDEELSREVARGIQSFSNLGQQIERGEGVMGKLLADEELGEELETIVMNVKTATADLKSVVAHVRTGEGSLGRILMDQELYDEALKSVKLLTRSLEDYREAAPITAFSGVLFGAF